MIAVDLKSNATDLVTETDKAVERLIVDGLKSKFPSHKFIGEEGTAELGTEVVDEFSNDPTWIIDPIDGTMNFVHRFPIHTNSIHFDVGLYSNEYNPFFII